MTVHISYILQEKISGTVPGQKCFVFRFGSERAINVSWLVQVCDIEITIEVNIEGNLKKNILEIYSL